MEGSFEVAIVGAGPYGLSVAAHLGAAGVEARVFGRPMAFWRRHMPAGMLLRSGWGASHIADPAGKLTLDAYAAARGAPLETPIPLDDFVDYGEWFLRQTAPDVDPRLVRQLERSNGAFRLTLEDGSAVDARSVVVATGLEGFAWRPPQFQALPPDCVSHSSDHPDFSDFAGRRVTVLGGGQSAAESAALLYEAGADVELVLRRPRLRWLRTARLETTGRLRRVIYPATEVGPPGLNWIVAIPPLFRSLPGWLQTPVAQRVLRPAVSDWLRPRLEDVRLRVDSTILAAEAGGDGLTLAFDDGSRSRVDHLLLATGYRVDLFRLPFLAPLAGSLRLLRGSPRLDRAFESSVAGLHFVGAAATESFGPITRFVTGTGYAARAVSAHLRESRPGQRAS